MLEEKVAELIAFNKDKVVSHKKAKIKTIFKPIQDDISDQSYTYS